MPAPAASVTVPEVWSRALRDPQLQDLPFKVETNTHDQLVLSPHKARHTKQQVRLVKLLDRLAEESSLPDGEAGFELAVATSEGVKVPDVLWMSHESWDAIPDDAEASPVMPEIVVEVLSASNTAAEMEEKRWLYLGGGAREVWTCDPDGRVRFYDGDGERETSALIPAFPKALGRGR